MTACFITEAHWSEVPAELPSPFSEVEKVVMYTNSALFPLQLGLFCFQ